MNHGKNMTKKFKRVTKPETASDRRRRDIVREQVKKEFPPKSPQRKSAVGIGVIFRKAREAQGLTWYAVAQAAGIPNSGTVRAIEEGQDAKLSSLEAIAKVLGLKLEVTEV